MYVFHLARASSATLRGFSSAIILALISLLIGYEAITRFIWPVPISFNEAIPIAVLGLAVDVASVLLLSGAVPVTTIITIMVIPTGTMTTMKRIAYKQTLAFCSSKYARREFRHV